MTTSKFPYVLSATVAAMFALADADGLRAQTLSGQVSSADEAAMEGVLVNAKKEGSTITTSVASNEKGEYSFPAGRLQPGRYTISIRAGGYVLGGPKTVEVTDGAVKADIKLMKTKNLGANCRMPSG